MMFDALCLMNALSGDSYYFTWYKAEYEHFNPLFTPEERAAFKAINFHIKVEARGIPSATLTLYFSTTNDKTLDEMIVSAEHPEVLKAAIKPTEYWDENEWAAFEKSQPSLVIALKALKRVGFEQYWGENVGPAVEAQIAKFTPTLGKYNIVPAIEQRLGHPLASNEVTIYLLAYSEPNGIRVTGTRLLTCYEYPFEIVLRNAIHEMMHPPFDRENPAVAAAIAKVGSEPLIAYEIASHDPALGYNTAPAYVEEDSVQALEELIEEQFDVGKDPKAYWHDQDGGMHVLAVAIYADLKADEKLGRVPGYQTWFLKAVGDGRLQGAALRGSIESVLGKDWQKTREQKIGPREPNSPQQPEQVSRLNE
jgi:hypothetical protein